MGNNRIYLADWNYDGDRVRLVYSDEEVVFVTKVDFDRAFGAIINAEKHEVIRDFAIKDGEE
ncbi:MAG: hypothetical protein Q4D44_00285 [Eubacteriales bacterium]|nr:hypothetical protein [Eubacteriales bacterium]